MWPFPQKMSVNFAIHGASWTVWGIHIRRVSSTRCITVQVLSRLHLNITSLASSCMKLRMPNPWILNGPCEYSKRKKRSFEWLHGIPNHKTISRTAARCHFVYHESPHHQDTGYLWRVILLIPLYHMFGKLLKFPVCGGFNHGGSFRQIGQHQTPESASFQAPINHLEGQRSRQLLGLSAWCAWL